MTINRATSRSRRRTAVTKSPSNANKPVPMKLAMIEIPKKVSGGTTIPNASARKLISTNKDLEH